MIQKKDLQEIELIGRGEFGGDKKLGSRLAANRYTGLIRLEEIHFDR